MTPNLFFDIFLAMSKYYVYIMTNNARTLYTGMTNDLLTDARKMIRGVSYCRPNPGFRWAPCGPLAAQRSIERRVYKHKYKLIPGFTKKYNVTQLVWFDDFDDPMQAIENEKRVKGWRREKKVALIEADNPEWSDLARDWFDAPVEVAT